MISASNNKSLYKTFNVGSKKSFMLRDIAKLMQNLAKDVEIEYVNFPEKIKDIEIGNYAGDYSKMKIVLDCASSLKRDLKRR